MAEHEWKPGDAVWFWSKKAHDWVRGNVWQSGVVKEQNRFILDLCVFHCGGYSVGVRDLRRRDRAENGQDKPTAESEAQRE